MSSISNFSSYSDDFPGTVPKAPKTIGTITACILNCLLTSAGKSIYLLTFSCSFCLTCGPLESKNPQCSRAFLPVNHYNIWSITTHFPVSLYWLVPVDCYFAITSLSVTTLDTRLYHLFHLGVPYFLSNNQWMCLSTTSCQIWYFVLANTEQPLLRSVDSQFQSIRHTTYTSVIHPGR